MRFRWCWLLPVAVAVVVAEYSCNGSIDGVVLVDDFWSFRGRMTTEL